MQLHNKTVIVTGASRGIGRQIAIECARRGANVALAARTVESRSTLPGSLGETMALIEDLGGSAIAVQCDVAHANDLERLVATTVEHFGRLDVVVNNAADMVGQDLEQLVAMMLGRTGQTDGAAEAAPPQSSPSTQLLDNWLRQFAINVHAPYTLMMLAVPHLRAQGGGVVINITSSAADLIPVERVRSMSKRERMVRNDRLGYAATKAALNRLTNAAALELFDDNIAVVAVDPGTTRTELAEMMGARGFVNPEDFAPMSMTVTAVLDVLTCDDPTSLSGEIVRAQVRSQRDPTANG